MRMIKPLVNRGLSPVVQLPWPTDWRIDDSSLPQLLREEYMKKLRTHYDNLQVSESASHEVIKGAYKYLSQKWHPDKNPHQREYAERVSKIINDAYEVLSDPAKRKEHDEWILSQRSRSDGEQHNSEPRYGAHDMGRFDKAATKSDPQNNAEMPRDNHINMKDSGERAYFMERILPTLAMLLLGALTSGATLAYARGNPLSVIATGSIVYAPGFVVVTLLISLMTWGIGYAVVGGLGRKIFWHILVYVAATIQLLMAMFNSYEIYELGANIAWPIHMLPYVLAYFAIGVFMRTKREIDNKLIELEHERDGLVGELAELDSHKSIMSIVVIGVAVIITGPVVGLVITRLILPGHDYGVLLACFLISLVIGGLYIGFNVTERQRVQSRLDNVQGEIARLRQEVSRRTW